MDYKEYIESGKLDSYVLGTATPEEAQEAECMARIFPEVRRELELIRGSFENYVLANGTNPPPELKSKIFKAIEEEEKNSSVKESKVVNLYEPSKKSNSPFKLLIAASLALVLVSAFIAFNLRKKNNELNARLTVLSVDQEAQKMHHDALQNKFENMQRQIAVMNNPDAVPVAMKGLKISPQSLAMIYWNKESKEVYLSVNSLPLPPPGMQYQLWAIVNKAPVDLGVFEMIMPDGSLFHKMKAVDGASAFAVTLEKAGGSAGPTLDQMYVIGNI